VSESLNWIKSTYSASGNCVEVAAADHVLIRDTQDRQGPLLTVSARAWADLVSRVKAS
jgi:hypothetical protein